MFSFSGREYPFGVVDSGPCIKTISIGACVFLDFLIYVAATGK
jgi:hypothetical protein